MWSFPKIVRMTAKSWLPVAHPIVTTDSTTVVVAFVEVVVVVVLHYLGSPGIIHIHTVAPVALVSVNPLIFSDLRAQLRLLVRSCAFWYKRGYYKMSLSINQSIYSIIKNAHSLQQLHNNECYGPEYPGYKIYFNLCILNSHFSLEKTVC